MAQNITFNGVVYSIPAVGDDSWGESLSDFFVAIPQGSLQKSGGTFTLSSEVNFGATYGLLSSYFKTRGLLPATTGLVRLNLTDTIAWRNNANSANLALGINGSDQLTFNGSVLQTSGNFITALTGDVTATGPGSVAATIASHAVTNAKLRQSVGLSILGNSTNATADVADITASVTNGVLVSSGSALTFALLTNGSIDPAAAISYSKLALAASIVNADISGSAAIAYSKLNLALGVVNGDISASAAISFSKLAALASGNILVGSAGGVPTSVAMSGDVTIGNTGITAIGANKVTDSMLAQMATASFKGRTSAGTGNVEVLSATQATAILNPFTGDSGAGGIKGLVPAPSAGDGAATKVLRADGTWGAAGTASPLTTKGDLYSYTTTNARFAIGSDEQVLIADALQSAGLRWSTRAPGPKNYITYRSFENNSTTGWSLGNVSVTNGLPTGVPSFGGAVATGLTIGIQNTNPLSGLYSLSYSQVTTATTAGNFLASNAITIDISDQAKVLAFKFNYSPTVNPGNANWSGTSSNSFGVAIYDITNSAWIIPDGVFNLVQSSGVGIAQGKFQTPSNMTQFRIVLYNANATSGAITVLLDDFYCGPQALAFGPAMDDFVNKGAGSITATTTAPTKGTTTTDKTWVKRIGDSIHIRWEFVMSGAGTTGTGSYLFNMPAGYVIDTTKVTTNTNNGSSNTLGFWTASTAGFKATGNVQAYNSTQLIFDVSGTNGTTTSVGNWASGRFDFAGAGQWSFEAIIPITGFSSNSVMSADSDTRFNGVDLGVSATTIGSAWTAINLIANKDSSGMLSGNSVTAPVTGWYDIGGNVVTSTNSAYTIGTRFQIGYSINSATVQSNLATMKAWGSSTTVGVISGSLLRYLNAGDVVRFFGINDPGNTSLDTGGDCRLWVKRNSGPAVIAATETISTRFTSSAALAITNSAFNFLDFPTKDYDDHSAVLGAGSGNVTTTNTGWRFIVPVVGKYRISANINLQSNATVTFTSFIISIFKNGSEITRGGRMDNYPTVSGTVMGIGVNDTLNLLPGDRIEIAAFQTSGASRNLDSSAGNYVSINRVGN